MRSPPRAARAHAAYMGLDAFVLRGKLKLRAGPELSTSAVGFLPPSAVVCILEQTELDDGTSRALVARFGESPPLGWVSCLSKDGQRNLIPFHFTRFQRFAKSAAASVETSTATNGDGKDEGESSASPDGTASPPPPSSPKRSPKRRVSRTPSPGPPGGPFPTDLDAALNAVGFAAKLTVADNKKSGRSSEREVERFKPQKAEQLHELVVGFETEIAEAEEGLAAIVKPSESLSLLKVTLGNALLSSDAKVSDLIKGWSKNAKGKNKGDIGQIDFRMHVRNVITWTNVKDIDALFANIDLNNDRSVSVSELTTFMKSLQEGARERDLQAIEVQKTVEFIRSRIELVKRAVDATKAAESAEARLQSDLSFTSVSTRLGKEMLRRATKISDLINGWESSRGAMDRKQFRKNVRSYGIDDENTALDEVFDSFDADGSGSIDIDELKVALGNLREASADSERELKDLKKRTEQLWKVAKAMQLELKKQQRADEVAKKQQAELKVKEEAERAAAAEEAKAAKEAAREAKRLKEAEEQAAYEAKIAQRRASALSPTNGRRASISEDEAAQAAAAFAVVMQTAAQWHKTGNHAATMDAPSA